jgi:Transposase
MRFLGIDWGERHHDLCLLDQDGMVLAARRITDGLAGVGELHALVAAHAQDPAEVAVGIETDRGLLVGAGGRWVSGVWGQPAHGEPLSRSAWQQPGQV